MTAWWRHGCPAELLAMTARWRLLQLFFQRETNPFFEEVCWVLTRPTPVLPYFHFHLRKDIHIPARSSVFGVRNTLRNLRLPPSRAAAVWGMVAQEELQLHLYLVGVTSVHLKSASDRGAHIPSGLPPLGLPVCYFYLGKPRT